jgi:hypothetical protein
MLEEIKYQLSTGNVFKNKRIFILNLVISIIGVASFFVLIVLGIWLFFMDGIHTVIHFPLPHPPYPPFKLTLDLAEARPTVSCDIKILRENHYNMSLIYKIQKTEVTLKEREAIKTVIEGRLNDYIYDKQPNKQEAHLVRLTIKKVLDDGKDELYEMIVTNPKLHTVQLIQEELITSLYAFYFGQGRYKLVVEGLNMTMPFQGVEAEIRLDPAGYRF